MRYFYHFYACCFLIFNCTQRGFKVIYFQNFYRNILKSCQAWENGTVLGLKYDFSAARERICAMLTRSRKALTVFSLAARMHADNFKIGGRRTADFCTSEPQIMIYDGFLTPWADFHTVMCHRNLQRKAYNSFPSPRSVPKSRQASHTYDKVCRVLSWFLKFKLPLTISRSIMYLFHCKYFEMWKSRNLILGFFVKQFFPKLAKICHLLLKVHRYRL